MNENIRALLAQASELLKANVVPPCAPDAEPPVRLALFCQPQQNPFGILQELYGGNLAPLNRAFYSGFHCVVSGGEAAAFFLTDSGERTPATAEALAERLGGFDSSRAPMHCEIELPNPALKGVELHVIASSDDYESIDWLEEITAYDGVLFVLRATALLAMAERKALRPLLRDARNVTDVLLIDNNMLQEDDRPDVDATLNSFLKGRAGVFRLPGTDAAALREKISAMPGRLQELRKLRAQRMEIVALRRACEAADVHLAALTAEEDHLEELLQMLNEKAVELPTRQEMACRRARLRYISSMRANMMTQLSDFYQNIMSRLEKDITDENAKDVDSLGDILPGYISSQWNNAIEAIAEQMREQMQEISQDLQDYLGKEIQEFLSEGMDPNMILAMLGTAEMYYGSAPKGQVDEKGFHVEVSPPTTSSYSTFCTIKTAVSVCCMSAFSPVLGLAVGIFSGAALFKQRKEEKIEHTRQAYLDASKKMCADAYDESVKLLEVSCSELERNINQSVEKCYQTVMNDMIQAITARKQDHQDHKAQIAAITELKGQMEKQLQE